MKKKFYNLEPWSQVNRPGVRSVMCHIRRSEARFICFEMDRDRSFQPAMAFFREVTVM